MAEEFDFIFDQVFRILIPTDAPDIQKAVDALKHLKSEIKSRRQETIAAGDFTLEQAVEAFGLKYSVGVSLVTGLNFWAIHAIPETQGFSPTSTLIPILFNYAENYDRSSEAACRISLDLILNECVTVLKGNGEALPTDYGRPKTPGPYNDLKICCEVSFSHKRFRPPLAQATTVNGRVDHGIGFVTKRRGNSTRVFYSLLLVVEAKIKNNIDTALPQLVVYLACLREFRKQRGRNDCTVYGVASDGFVFMFVMITHDGVLKLSKRFDALHGELTVVLGCLNYILGKSAAMRPGVTPEKIDQKSDANETDETADIGDTVMDLDDNVFIRPPVDDEDAVERGVRMSCSV